jgi:pimeloyl-ACP methyl ester carboxylesterase
MIKPIGRKTKYFLWIGGFILLFQLTSGCFSFRMSQKEVNKYFSQSPVKPTISKYKVEGRTINYASIGSDTLPTVIFLHGAPGSWSAFVSFFAKSSLYDKAKLISVDRPGYGYSDFGNSEPSLDRQAELLKKILEDNSSTATILVGHSLGGPMIAKLAIKYPDLVDALIMVAPSIDPKLEPDEFWFRMPLHTPFLRWVLPTSIRVTNDEIYFLKDELEAMLPYWSEIKIPVTVIQGKLDELVPAGNADFAKKMLTNSPEVDIIMVEDKGHFVLWEDPQLIEQAILKHLKYHHHLAMAAPQ